MPTKRKTVEAPVVTPTTALMEAWAEVPREQRADALDAVRLVLADRDVLRLINSWGFAEYALGGLPRDLREATYARCIDAVVKVIRGAGSPRPVQPPRRAALPRRRGNLLAFVKPEVCA